MWKSAPLPPGVPSRPARKISRMCSRISRMVGLELLPVSPCKTQGPPKASIIGPEHGLISPQIPQPPSENSRRFRCGNPAVKPSVAGLRTAGLSPGEDSRGPDRPAGRCLPAVLPNRYRIGGVRRQTCRRPGAKPGDWPRAATPETGGSEYGGFSVPTRSYVAPCPGGLGR